MDDYKGFPGTLRATKFLQLFIFNTQIQGLQLETGSLYDFN